MNRSDAALETPVPQIIHDLGNGVGGFGSLIYNVTPSDQLRRVASSRRDFYQVPNTPEQQSICLQPILPMPNCSVRDADHESDSFVNLSWVRMLSPGAVDVLGNSNIFFASRHRPRAHPRMRNYRVFAGSCLQMRLSGQFRQNTPSAKSGVLCAS